MKKIELLPLWDLYGGLLTDVQQDICNLYFNLDLTVSEIASERGASRQAVSECVKTCVARLNEFEEKCGALKQIEKSALRHSEILDAVESELRRTADKHPEIADELLIKIKALRKRYQSE